MAAKLKVYRTAIGFHDAYVAAASQKAALEAWGTDKPLFARGAAELVTDPALTAEPLANPGEVVKRLRGSEAEQIAALPPNKSKAKPVTEQTAPRAVKAKPPQPKPSRSELSAAEDAVSQAQARHDQTRAALKAREQRLQAERRELERQQASELEQLSAAQSDARTRYDAAMSRWAGNKRD